MKAQRSMSTVAGLQAEVVKLRAESFSEQEQCSQKHKSILEQLQDAKRLREMEVNELRLNEEEAVAGLRLEVMQLSREKLSLRAELNQRCTESHELRMLSESLLQELEDERMMRSMEIKQCQSVKREMDAERSML